MVQISSRLFSVLMIVLVSLALAETQRPQAGRGQWLSVAEGSIRTAPALHVKIDGGSVRVEGHAGNSISYTIRRRVTAQLPERTSPSSLYKVSSYVQGDTSWLVVSQTSERQRLAAKELVVGVPTGLKLVSIETPGGDVSVEGVQARVQIVSGGGRIALGKIDGSIQAETGGQDVDVGAINGDARFRTGGGRISVDYVKGNLDAWTGGGAIRLDRGMRDAVLETAAGDVRVTYCGGELKVIGGGGNVFLGDVASAANIRTVGGNIRLHSAKGFVKAHTSAGNIELQGVPGADAETEAGSIVARFVAPVPGAMHGSSLRTPTGDIDVYLPAGLPITIQASVDLAAGRGIDSEFPEIRTVSEGENVDASLIAGGKLNGGGPLLRIHTSTGNIRIRREER